MPPAYRTSVTGGDTSGTADRTLAITAVAGDLLVVFASISDFATAVVTDNASGTYARVGTGRWGVGDQGVAFVRTALVATGASITVTLDTDTNSAAALAIVAVSGMLRAGSSAIRGHGMDAAKGAATVTAILNRKPLVAKNVIIGCCASSDTTVTPPTDFTERHDVNQVTPTTALEVVTRDPNGTDPSGLATSGSAQWSGLVSTDSVAILIELESLPIVQWAQVGHQVIDIAATGDYTDGLTTYVPSPGTRAIELELVGGGGAGGQGTTVTGAAGGGGASGEWARIRYESDATIVGGAAEVGLGGAGASTSAGGNTSLTVDGITFTAVGGTAGSTNAANATYPEAAAPALAGSGNTSFDVNRGANHSVAAMITATTAGITAFTGGIGGNTPFGRGGLGSGGDANGADGTGYGAGGGGGRRGAATNRVGGSGVNGVIIIKEFAPVPTAAEVAAAVEALLSTNHGSGFWDTVPSINTFVHSQPVLGQVLTSKVYIVDADNDPVAPDATPVLTILRDDGVSISLTGIHTWTNLGTGEYQVSLTLSGAVFAVGRSYTASVACAVSTVPIEGIPLGFPAFEIIEAVATAAALNIVDDFIDTEVAAIKAKTDSLTFTVAGKVDSNVTHWIGTVPVTPTTAGVPRVDVRAIEANVITATAINAAALTNAKFAAGAIAAGTFAAGAIDAAAIASNAITSAKIATDAIGAAQIAADAIGSSELATSAVTEIQTGLSLSTDVTAIKTKTDQLTFTVTNRVDATASLGTDSISAAALSQGAADKIRDSLLNYALRTGRTVRGHWRRMDSLFFGKVTGLIGSLVTGYQPDGVTTEISAVQNTALGTRDAATVTNSETP